MICRHGGLTFVRHNEIRDLTAEWLNKVCYDVATEPPLQPLSGEAIVPMTANRQDEARADIHARGFWGRRQGAFFDVRVFHPNAPSYRGSSIQSLYRRHEREKKREYGDRVREIKLASFTPLIFATTGVWAGKPPSSITDLLTYCPTRTMYRMILCWHGLDAHCLSRCYDLLQCASVAAGPSPIDQLMLHQRWAWLTATGTIRYI